MDLKDRINVSLYSLFLSTGPCTGENCDHHSNDKLGIGQPTLEPVLQMHQESVSSGSDALNIDPDSLLHPVGGSHVHGEAPPAGAEEQDVGADAPDVGKELHGRVADVGTIDAGSGEVPIQEEHGPDMEATLHGGLKHVHSPETTGDPLQPVEHDGVIGVDPEEILHGAKDSHSHGESNPGERQISQGNFDLGTDMEALLHGGDEHVHSSERKPEEGSDAIPEVPIGASDPEAFLHDGDGHVHAHGGATERNDPDPRQYGAADPEQVLHGSDEQHVHTVRQAMDGSRPLSGTKDPDVVGVDVNPMDVRVGTLRPEDTEDYRKWKTEKEKQTQDPSQASSWLSGFSYIKDSLLRDLEVVRKRYLTSFFGDAEEEDSTSKATSKRTHDEA